MTVPWISWHDNSTCRDSVMFENNLWWNGTAEDKESVELGNENDTLDEKTMGTQTDTSNLLKIVLFWVSPFVFYQGYVY